MKGKIETAGGIVTCWYLSLESVKLYLIVPSKWASGEPGNGRADGCGCGNGCGSSRRPGQFGCTVCMYVVCTCVCMYVCS